MKNKKNKIDGMVLGVDVDSEEKNPNEYNGIIMDDFEKRATGWIMNEEGKTKWYWNTKIFKTEKPVLERIVFNVVDAYRDLIRFPEHCPGCTRSGRDHDGECPTEYWEGPDHGLFEEK